MCIALNIFELIIHIKMPVCLQTSLFITQGDLQKIKGRVEGMTLQLQCYEVTSRRAFWKLAGPGENFNSQMPDLAPTLVQASYIGKFDLNVELCSFSVFER